ncbi:MAG: PAS domain S-box protein [Pirellulales bacterium]|nr:PAS domain S-box protein [Pirellulales bacterium]
MSEPRTTQRALGITFAICLALSATSTLCAAGGVPFFPVRYVLDAAAAAVLVLTAIAVVFRHRIYRYDRVIVCTTGVLLMAVQLAAGSGEYWLFGDGGLMVGTSFKRLVLQPLADVVLVLGAYGLSYLYLFGWEQRNDALRRAESEAALQSSAEILEQRVVERTAALEATNSRLQAEIERGSQTAEKLRGQQRVLEGLLAAHDRDRQILAYDIHDGPVQLLTGALFQLEAARSLCPEIPPEALEQFVMALGQIRRALHDSRNVISGMRPPILDEQGLIEGLRYLVAEHLEADGCPVEFVHQGDGRRLSPLIEGTIYRIAQESLQNIRRHSRASQAWLHLDIGAETMQLEVRDNGVGFLFPFEAPSTGRFGMRGIFDRASALLGHASIQSAPGQGTRVVVELPCVDALERAIRDRMLAEATLAERERLYRLLADHSSDVIARHAADGTVLYISPSCKGMYGYDPEDIVGRSPFEVVHPDDHEQVRASMAEQEARSEHLRFTFRAMNKRGEIRWIECYGRRIINEETGQIEYVTDSRDVTDRHDAEERLRTSEEMFRSTIVSAPIGIIIGEGDPGNIVYANPKAREMAEDTDGNILRGQNWHQLFDPVELERAFQAVLAGVVHRQFNGITLRVVTRSGQEKWVRFVADIARTNGPSGPRRIALAEDVTETIRADAARREAESRFADLVAALPDMVFRVRYDGTLDDYVPAEGLAPHVPAAQFQGRRLSEVLPHSVAEAGLHAIERAIETGRLQVIEYDLPEADGVRRYEARVAPTTGRAAFVFVREIAPRATRDGHDREHTTAGAPHLGATGDLGLSRAAAVHPVQPDPGRAGP